MTKQAFFKLPHSFGDLCMPAKIYLILTFISVISYALTMYRAKRSLPEDSDVPIQRYTVPSMIGNIVFATLWILLLNYLCKTGHLTLSWVLLFSPAILMLVVVLSTMFTISYITAKSRVTTKQTL